MITPEDCEKKAVDVGLDLTKQFLTLALAGIAFVSGLAFSSPGSIGSLMLWLVIGVFGASAILGTSFWMHGVNLLSIKKNYDIYASSLRWLAVGQILFVLAGVVLLIPVLNTRPTAKVNAVPSSSMEIKVDPRQSVLYPIDPKKNVVIEMEGARVKITAANK